MLNAEDCQMAGASRPVRSPLNSAAFLIETQVRIEIAATHRKQRKAAISNRNFFRGPGCAGEPAQKVVGPHVAERIFGAALAVSSTACADFLAQLRSRASGRSSHAGAGIDPRHRPVRLSHPTASAGFLAQLRSRAGGRGSHRGAGIDPRHRPVRLSHPTACADFLAQLRSRASGRGSHGAAGIDPRHRPVRPSHPTACAGTSAQSPPCAVALRICLSGLLVTLLSPLTTAFLTATVANSKNKSTRSKRSTKQISNRNKFVCFVIHRRDEERSFRLRPTPAELWRGREIARGFAQDDGVESKTREKRPPEGGRYIGKRKGAGSPPLRLWRACRMAAVRSGADPEERSFARCARSG
jgi:hypothetical protein